jgi:hypothetical protein
MPSAGKVMLTVFWNSQGLLIEMWILHPDVKVCWGFELQLAETFQAIWEEERCFITSIPGEDPGAAVRSSRTAAIALLAALDLSDLHAFDQDLVGDTRGWNWGTE